MERLNIESLKSKLACLQKSDERGSVKQKEMGCKDRGRCSQPSESGLLQILCFQNPDVGILSAYISPLKDVEYNTSMHRRFSSDTFQFVVFLNKHLTAGLDAASGKL